MGGRDGDWVDGRGGGARGPRSALHTVLTPPLCPASTQQAHNSHSPGSWHACTSSAKRGRRIFLILLALSAAGKQDCLWTTCPPRAHDAPATRRQEPAVGGVDGVSRSPGMWLIVERGPEHRPSGTFRNSCFVALWCLPSLKITDLLYRKTERADSVEFLVPDRLSYDKLNECDCETLTSPWLGGYAAPHRRWQRYWSRCRACTRHSHGRVPFVCRHTTAQQLLRR